ncbi:MAG: penicillin-insensitive murein endopeptidase [Fibrobacterales bacterium]
MKCFWILLLIAFSSIYSAESVCYGGTHNGRLEQGQRLPSSGPNFTSYSSVGEMLGRTYLHSRVVALVIESYKVLEDSMPFKEFKYAETGLREGGKFSPHKTHRNGLSVDFMVPVLKEQVSVHLPTHIFNKFGYAIEFDSHGRYEEYTIDYEAMAYHIVTLHKVAKGRGYDLKRVIFDPVLQKRLFKTSHGDYLKKYIRFSQKKSWVRHDEHYHIDFEIPCK